MAERDDIERSIEALNAQRDIVGDDVVDAAIRALVDKLAALQEESFPSEEQRKQVTILFCDLVDFTALAETMDPETMRDILGSFFSPWHTVVARHNGKLEKFIGDAVMAAFGVPTATERDPEHAIHAALEFREQLVMLNDQLDEIYGVRLTFRIGINTGSVVVGDLGRDGEFTVTGDTVNVASRLQGAAPNNAILISHDTYRHVRGVFDVELLPEIHVKGKTEPIMAYKVKRAKPRAFRISTRGIEGLETRTIGREAAIARLEEAWMTVNRDRQARLVVISGDAGVGKSRLLYDFKNWMELRPERFWLFQGRATQEARHLPYSLARDLICFRFQISDKDDITGVQEKLEHGVSGFVGKNRTADEMAHFIGQLLGYDFSSSSYLSGILHDPAQIRDRAIHSFAQFMIAAAATDPVVIYLEDVHWADQGSLDLLDHVRETCRRQPLLLVSTARPEFFERSTVWKDSVDSPPDDQPKSLLQTIELHPLSMEDTHRLIHEILRLVEGTPEALVREIAQRSEGNPFYLEEIVKMLIEDGVIVKGAKRWWIAPSKLASVRIPPTLTGLLQARLDALSHPERDTLQRASIVGRVFWDGTVAYLASGLSPQDQRLNSGGIPFASNGMDIETTLESLCRHELIQRRDDSAFAHNQEFIFKHALLHDVAYETVLKRQRREYHGKTARWLLLHGESHTRQHAGLIARHFDLADEPEEAAGWYARAAGFAKEQFANQEALGHVDRALDLLSEEAFEARYDALLIRVAVHDRRGERDAQQEDINMLELIANRLKDEKRVAETNIQKIVLNNAIGDYSTAAKAARRAIASAQDVEDVDLEAQAYLHWSETLWRTGDYDEAQERLRKARSLGKAISSRKLEAGTLRNLGAVLMHKGAYDEARTHLLDSLDAFREMGDRTGECAALNNLGLALFYLGNYQGARGAYQKALDIFRTIGHRHGEASVLNNLGMVSNFQEDYGSALRYYREALTISQDIEHRANETMALSNVGFVLASTGRYEEAIGYYEQALALSRAINDKRLQQNILINFGLARFHIADLSTALDHFGESLKLARQLNNTAGQVEAITYRGHAFLSQGEPAEAERSYHEALSFVPTEEDAEIPVELLVGQMQLAHGSGNQDRAFHLADELIPRLETLGLEDTLEPMRVFLFCYEILRDNHDPRAHAVLQAANKRLQAIAATIIEDDLRRSFLEDIPTNKAIGEAWSQTEKCT